METLFTTEALLSLLTLTLLEVVLGIDNVIFISILSAKLPLEKRDSARRLGLFGALGTRLVLLAFISYIVGLTQPLFSVAGVVFSGKSLILFAGGFFSL